MDSFFQFCFIALAIVAALALLPWVMYVGARLVSATIGDIGGLVADSFGSAYESRRRWETRRATTAAAADVLRSSRVRRSKSGRAGAEIYAMAEVLRRSIESCCEIHHYTGTVLNVEHMNELEEHHVCAAFRGQVLDTIDVTLESLMKTNVAADITAAKMLVGIDRMRDICADCQLLQFTRADVPRLCDPAVHMGCSEKEPAA